MNTKDIREWFAVVIGFILDFPQFVRSPRVFIQRVVLEARTTTCLRLLSYAILFDLSCVFLLAFRILPKLSPWLLFLALFCVPFFLVANKITQAGATAKEIVVYSVMYKFTWLFPAVVVYALFLFSEDYLFVWPRGAIYWLGLVSMPVLWPFLVRQGMQRRILAAALSFVLLHSSSLAIGYLLFRNPIPRHRLAKISLLYDPITAEFNQLEEKKLYRPDYAVLFGTQHRLTGSLVRRDNQVLLNRSQYNSALADLDALGAALREPAEAESDVRWIKEYIAKAEYQRNRDLGSLALKMSENLVRSSASLKRVKESDVVAALQQMVEANRVVITALENTKSYDLAMTRAMEFQIKLLDSFMVVW